MGALLAGWIESSTLPAVHRGWCRRRNWSMCPNSPSPFSFLSSSFFLRIRASSGVRPTPPLRTLP